MQIEEEVKADIERLLAMVCSDKTDPDAYEFVLKRLTRMAMLGTAPASCQMKKNEPTNSMQPFSREPGLRRRHSAFDSEDDDAREEWSRAKENFIAR